MSHSNTVTMDLNPALRPGLDALDWWLADAGYHSHARAAIVRHAAAEGTPTGSVYLDAADEGEATEAFVSALPFVRMDAPAWDREDVVLDAEMLAENRHPWPFGAMLDDVDRSIPAGAALVPPELLELAPICGGSPEPYEPTEEDWADYRAWCAEVEARDARRRGDDARSPAFGYE